MARKPDIDLAKIEATTEQDIRRHMREEGYDPDRSDPERGHHLAGGDP